MPFKNPDEIHTLHIIFISVHMEWGQMQIYVSVIST